MTRFKKELMKRNYRLEETEMTLPTRDGIQCIEVDSENITYTIHHTSISIKLTFDRAFNEIEVGYF